MRKYYYKPKDGTEWKGPIGILKLLLEFMRSQVNAHTEVWHQGICKGKPQVEHPEKCEHGTKNFGELSIIKYLFISWNAKRSKNREWVFAKLTMELLGLGFTFFTLVSITVFSFTYNSYKQTVNHYHLEYLKEFNDHVDSLKAIGGIDETTEIGVELEPKRDFNFFAKSYCNLEVKYTIDVNISNYELGQYDVMENKNTREAVKIFIHHVQRLESAYHTNGPIDVGVYGSTDATPITTPIIYKGEYGHLISKRYIDQSSERIVSLSPGETFDQNTVLGFLRGYSSWHYLRSYGDSFITQNTSFQEYVITNDQRGGGYRSIQIVIRYFDVDAKSLPDS